MERVDVDAALAALFDIRCEIVRIRELLLEEDDGETPQEVEDDA